MTSTLEAADVQEQARATYRQRLAADQTLTGRALGSMYGKSERWGRDRIAEVRQADGTRQADDTLDLEIAAALPSIERQPVAAVAAEVPAAEPVAEPVTAEQELPKWVVPLAVIAVAVVAIVAATVSYEHMRELAMRCGEGWRSWLMPLSADGLILAGSLVMYVRSRTRQSVGRLPWLALLGGLAVSVAANVGTALLPAVGPVAIGVRMTVAGFPPVALIIAAELLMQLVRARSRVR